MSHDQLAFMSLAILLVAFLYSSVGHAGASGYIAIMSLFGVAATVIRPAALVLNILVATIASWQFWRAGHFQFRLFWPFAVLAIPCAFLGGYIHLPTRMFQVLVGAVLLFSAARFFAKPSDDTVRKEPSPWHAVPIGAGLGLLSGLTGTGGGIFLTPLLLFMRWARARQAAAVSAVFILANSSAGLLGNVVSTSSFPAFVVPFAVAAVLGGIAGSYLGSRRLPHQAIKRLLAVVLLIAGLKLLLT
ncbi:MAG TPA: sulfite exporter TauE/SafE family protein [Verrucomicrobiae bacterium]|nr:sulfite exporter TauE/SafE family protein [Verrucomicrobiae bacterium]